MRLRCHLTVTLAVLTLVPATLHAQRRVSLDVTVGAATGVGGGEWKGRTGGAVDALLARAVRPARGGALLVGASAALQGALGSNDMCVFDRLRTRCLDEFPALVSVGLLGGWEGRTGRGRSTGATLRALAGPAFVHVDGDDGQRGSTVGFQGRVDAATPHWGPMALVASLRGTAIPRFRGRALGSGAFGVGVRVR